MTEEEVVTAVHTMKKNKVTGSDSMSIEVFKASVTTQKMLYSLLDRMWKEEEEVPQAFGQAVFVMLYKNKGSTNDPTKYRCIDLLNHACEVLSTIILGRINTETDDYLQD